MYRLSRHRLDMSRLVENFGYRCKKDKKFLIPDPLLRSLWMEMEQENKE